MIGQTDYLRVAQFAELAAHLMTSDGCHCFGWNSSKIHPASALLYPFLVLFTGHWGQEGSQQGHSSCCCSSSQGGCYPEFACQGGGGDFMMHVPQGSVHTSNQSFQSGIGQCLDAAHCLWGFVRYQAWIFLGIWAIPNGNRPYSRSPG